MFGLTTLGVVHTAISLIALGTGFYALVRDGEISPRRIVGRWYLWTTVLTCLTGFGIFQHGGFGPPHVLGLLTLIVLGAATLAEHSTAFGRAARYVSVLGYSLSYFFHWVPATTETFTRLPVGAPLFSSPEDPALQKVVGVFFLLFVAGAAWQVRRLRRQQLSPSGYAGMA
jgi:uncharacterized membrane protein